MVSRLQVRIICPDCNMSRNLLVRGPWDIVDVRHCCEPDPNGPGPSTARRRTPAGKVAWVVERRMEN